MAEQDTSKVGDAVNNAPKVPDGKAPEAPKAGNTAAPAPAAPAKVEGNKEAPKADTKPAPKTREIPPSPVETYPGESLKYIETDREDHPAFKLGQTRF